MATATRSPGFATDQKLRPPRKLDGLLVLATLALLFFGLMSLYSLRAAGDTVSFKKQLINLAVGVVPFSLCAFVDPRTWKRWANVLYVINLLALIATLKMGSEIKGAQRWIDIGPLQFQPSELSKLLLILTLSAFFANRLGEEKKLSTYLLSLAHLAIPAALVFKQPHLGATLVLLVIWLSISLASNVPLKFIFTSAAVAVAAIVFAFTVPGLMHDYQKDRVIGILQSNSKDNEQDKGYQTTRARIAFGVGGLFGTGFMQGEQKRGHFIPEQETDFIITVIGEEGGLVGTTCVLLVYAFFFYRLWLVMLRATEPYYRMVAAGIFGMLAFHTVVNLGMVLQLLPVVGLWLPFMSYGGTALWLCMASVGLLLNIKSREKPLLF